LADGICPPSAEKIVFLGVFGRFALQTRCWDFIRAGGFSYRNCHTEVETAVRRKSRSEPSPSGTGGARKDIRRFTISPASGWCGAGLAGQIPIL